MKIRRSVLWLTVLVIAATSLLVWLSRRPAPTSLPRTPGVRQPEAAVARESNRLGRKVSPRDSPPAPKPASSNELSATDANEVMRQYRQGLIDWGQARRAILSLENDVPIEFYGKLEDQFRLPLVGAIVHFSVHIENGRAAGVKEAETLTDADGRFTISGYTGERLSIRPEMAGYAIASMNCGVVFSHLWPQTQVHHPDPNNPVIIKMWKLQGAEPLLRINQSLKLHYTESPIRLDLLSGRIVPSGGDISITVTRPPGNLSRWNRRDWSARFEAIDGGIMDSSGQELITYWAPETGYEPSATVLMSTNPPHKWYEGFTRGFFVFSRNGRVYSKLGVSFGINDTPDGLLSVELSGVANTNGSRNWEGDANTLRPQ